MSQLIQTTVRELIRRSMMLVGILGEAENPTDTAANDALLTINEIIDKWNIENLMIPVNSYVEFPLDGKEKYSIGPTGDIVSYRPNSGVIDAQYLQDKFKITLNILTQVQYNRLNQEIYTADYKNYPTSIYYNPQYPNGEIYVFPKGYAGKIRLTVQSILQGFQSLDEIVDMPPAYYKALRYGLAVELSIEYGRQLNPEVTSLAVSAKGVIKGLNGANKLNIMPIDPIFARSGRRGTFINDFYLGNF